MPHSIDDTPSPPPAESAGNDAPSAISQGAVPDGAPESAREGAAAAEALRRPRHRRRRRRRPPPSTSPEPATTSPEPAEGREAPAGEAESVEPAASPEAATGAEGVESGPPGEGRPQNPPRRRRRRRRGPPRDPGAQPASAGGDGQTREAEPEGNGEQSAEEDPARSEGAQLAPQDAGPREHFRRRHRHRRPPRPMGSADQGAGSEAKAEADGTVREGNRVARGPPIGGPRNRSPREARPRPGEPRGASARERHGPAARREGEPRDRGRPTRGSRG